MPVISANSCNVALREGCCLRWGSGGSEDITAQGGGEGRGQGQAEPQGSLGAEGAEAEQAKAL